MCSAFNNVQRANTVLKKDMQKRSQKNYSAGMKFTVCSAQFYAVRCRMYTLLCTVYCIQIYSVYCSMYTVTVLYTHCKHIKLAMSIVHSFLYSEQI